jgi:hypothetical protein
MYMIEVLGGKCISQNMLHMKNETCEPTTPPTRDFVIVGCKMYMVEVFTFTIINKIKIQKFQIYI